MTGTDLRPARLIPPGTILKRELEARGWTQKDLARITGRPEQAISEIMNGEKRITAETAIQLGAAFGTSAELWLNLDANFRLDGARRGTETSEIERRARLYGMLPISEMMRRGYIRRADSLDQLEIDVCKFLGTSDIETPPTLVASFRGSEGKNANEPRCLVWLKRVENLTRRQTLSGFLPERFEGEGVPALLSLAAHSRGVKDIPELLAGHGVHLITVPHFEKTYLDGAAFRVDGEPVVALSLRYDRIDSFWFTLMHEVAHLVYDESKAFLDNMDEQGAGVEERRANRKAEDWLIPPDSFQSFLGVGRRHFSRDEITSFARSIGRHPGIVVGRLHRERQVPYRNLRGMLTKVSPYLISQIDAEDVA